MLQIYYDKYDGFPDVKKINPKTLFLNNYDYSMWSENEKSTDKEKSTDVPPIPPLEGDEQEEKEGKGLRSKQTIN